MVGTIKCLALIHYTIPVVEQASTYTDNSAPLVCLDVGTELRVPDMDGGCIDAVPYYESPPSGNPR